MKPYTIYVIDDEVDVAAAVCTSLELDGYQCRPLHSLTQARTQLGGVEELFITILDHDFATVAGEAETGYEFGRWLKEQHWAAYVLPIIYLTGRETPAGYVRARRELAGYAPDDFLNKNELAVNPELLGQRVDFFADRLLAFDDAVAEHGVQVARGMFGEWWL